MTEESILRARQNCCRLCLAPDSECISIFNSYAADKEPLANKIQSCVNIKVSPIDRLSLRICHACISYLNSWQSFKNRCVASQNKQRSWLDITKKFEKRQLSAAVPLANALTSLSACHDDGSASGGGGGVPGGVGDEQENIKLASSILEGISSLKKRRSLTVYPIPVHIKDEPIDEEDYDAKHDESDIDPTLFLERTEEEGSDNLSQKEQHLASLGLKQSGGSVHPLSYLADYSFEGEKPQQPPADKPAEITSTPIPTNEVKEASCRACNLKFSTRANARRHERNLHPHLFLGAMPPSLPTKAALNMISPMTQAIVASAPMIQTIQPVIKSEQLGLFDYDQPEKYQHLLSDDKILFMQRQEDFLQQYQNMTCNCCLRTHATYKNFMAHMRKKYHSLPRNLCFKCLKQNDSKALFISHLKKRNCINLYKIYHSLIDAGVLKKDALSCSPDKLRAKELLVNKIYECKICSKHYRLKLEFRSHVYEEHADYQKKDVSPGHCGFCGLEIEDPFERKRHYNNMDCIVILRCITCEEKFDNHQKFLDHVYSKHLANNNETQKSNLMKELGPPPLSSNSTENSPSKKSEAPAKPPFFSRLPQSCNICGQHYNNYNNVLRHMESKHPDQLPQTYKCTRCLIGYPRLMNLREHMIEVHGMKVDKVRNNSFDYIVDSPTVQGSIPRGAEKGTVDSYTGRYDYVMKDLMSITNGGSGGNEGHGENEDDDNKSDSPTPKKIKLESGAAVAVGTASLKECPICSAVFNNNIGLSNHMRTHTTEDGVGGGVSSAGVSAAGAGVEDDVHDEDDDALDKKPIDPLFRRSLELAADRRFRRMRCRICQKRFSSKKSYRRHMLIDHQIRNVQFIKCKLCDAEFAYEKGLKVHMFKIHNTLLKDEMIVKQYECDICSIVYRTEEQLLLHKKSVHGNESAAAEEDLPPSVDQSMEATPAPVYWYQCRYCPSNFNTNKKLAIHINSHYEFDSNDYSCKDCGNVYSGRKSLWVHRYKKHPPVADPSECAICKKTFFDKQMLENHAQSCAQKRAAASSAEAVSTYFQHKTGDDDELTDKPDTSNVVGENTTAAVNLKIKLPEVVCTICAQKFTDQELFTKHIQMHEMELYTDNPLAAMFDTGPADPNQFYLDRVNDNGQYVCDICSKAFAQMTALKVHRKWHFRGDSKQTPVDPNAPKKTVKRKRELKCDYCPSTFISSNNLRRHIAELHKSEISNWPEPPKIEPEKYLHCTKCDLKFETKKDWIDHKVNEAKIAKPFGPFQWGCEICGVYLSRREKLIHHMLAHIKEINGQLNSAADNYPGESNSQDSESSSHHGAPEQPAADDDEAEEEEEEEDDDDELEETVETENHDQNANDGQNESSKLRQRLQRVSNDDSNDSTTSSDSDGSSSDEEDAEGSSRHEEIKKRHACDLCQVDFESSGELQKHVTSHFLNGPGSVTLTTITKEKSIPAQIPAKVDDDNDGEDEDDDDDDDDNVTDADPADYSFEGEKPQQPPADKPAEITSTPIPTNEVKEASCRACNLKFSTRANARRHERNLHPHLFLGAMPPSLPTKAALNMISPMTQAIVASAPMIQTIQPVIKSEQLGLFDYDQPEKYQHLLSDDKILFMQRQEDFLQQYQNMTCNCCLRTHATYKNFMAHMRKKYHSLPRNLCFKCLKQNDSKALFISHLKKRNCINLYKIYHSLIDAGVLKKDALSCSPDKLRAKELLVNKIYECKICSKHYRLKLEFRSHVYEEHADYQKKDVSPGHCGFCGLEIEDPFERKRHYNNMDCIVILRCITCEEKFDNHQKFLDHVYSKHLANNNETQKSNLMKELGPPPLSSNSTENSPSKKSEAPAKPPFFSRLPQSCNICGQHYNNYNNVLRHMESKHPDQLPQTYKCTRCLIGYPRLMNLREHMIEVHGMKVDKVRNNSFDYIVDSPTVQGSIPRGAEKGTVDSYTGRYDYVMKDLMSITNGGSGGNEGHGENEDDDNKSDSPTPKKIKLESGAAVAVGTASLKECPICSAVFNNNIGLSNHMRTHTTEDGVGGGVSSAGVSAAGAGVEDDVHDEDDDALDKKPIDPLFRRSLELAADRRFRRMRCRICQKRFSSKKSYRRHMLIDHQIRNVQFIKCKLCDAEFAYEKGLKVHMFKIHNTLLKDEMIVKQYECDICSIVYRTEEQLLLHKKSVHGNESAAAEEDLPPSVDQSMEATPAPVYWYQCRYCPSNFNTNKKLAIHINSHYEFDSNDYSCKDCGNVYSGRKSLWVHRYKKHPPVADPSECAICKKTFFDKQMLENHAQSCAQKRAAASSAEAVSTYFQHKTGDDDELTDKPDTSNVVGENTTAAVNLKIKLPEVVCTICAQKFTDQELFTKHIQMHEMELYTDNPLAAMFDTGPADPNQFYLDRVNDNGQYVCDICSKAFAQMTALKVHRKWHFRGDSKQTPVDPNAPKKTVKRKRELKCDYCPSTFISSNNLRRHIAELHKSEISNWPEPPKIEPEKYLHCTKCDLKFETKKDWIDHKVNEAKIAKPFGPFQWGCEICGVYLSRREKLIHHMLAHIKEINGQLNSAADNYPGESNSQDSESSSHHGAPEQPAADDDEAEEEEEEEDDDDELEETVETENHDQNANDGQNESSKLRQRLQRVSNDDSNDSTTSSDSDGSSSDEEDAEGSSRHEEIKKRHACDLCQVDFESSGELQKHVTSHFLNGPGSVTLTTITKEKSIPAQIPAKVDDDNDGEDEDDDDDDDDNLTDADPVDS